MKSLSESSFLHISNHEPLREIGLLFVIALLFHGMLLPYTIAGSYDAYIHMFFGDHYNRSWFDPWEPRWYTGFSTTSYPPATHMMIGALMTFLPLKGAYIVTMLFGILLLVLGFYRFTRIWAPHAAWLATLLLIFSSAIAQTLHIYGQLPTLFSLGLFLNATPFMYRWLVFGQWKELIFALILASATTSAHHVTTIFGGVFFVGPLTTFALMVYFREQHIFDQQSTSKAIRKALTPFIRIFLLMITLFLVIGATIYPYWHWSLTDPITQVPIPHGSRENFLIRTDLGTVFVLMPWGIMLFFLPYFFYKGLTSALWPFTASMMLGFVLGLGSTTPLSPLILRGAFDILTLDRFTLWSTILALPFMAMTILSINSGGLGAELTRRFGSGLRYFCLASITVGFSLITVSIVTLSAHKSLQPRTIDPAPIVSFMESDEHDRWRYLTLGFGDQFAYISAQTSALSVDGNYHSARRLPAFTRYSVERLENAKYMGVAGLGSLQQFLTNANDYHLKFIFSNDKFYDPLLYATGWNEILRLPNNIVVWEKPNIDPLPYVLPRKNFPTVDRLYWGLVPPFMLSLAILILAYTLFRQIKNPRPNFHRTFRVKNWARLGDLKVLMPSLIVTSTLLLGFWAYLEWNRSKISHEPDGIISRYYWHLNARQWEEAYQLLDPVTRPEFDAFLFSRMWQGGLIHSFGSLLDMDIQAIGEPRNLRDYRVDSRWITALGFQNLQETLRTVHRDEGWYIIPNALPAYQTPERLMARTQTNFHVVGRRQARIETDFYKDMPDRPEFSVQDAKIVKWKGQYSLIGLAHNTDVDPMALSITGELFDSEYKKLITGSAGIVTPFRLLPSEASGFRVDFEARLSLEAAQDLKGFSPETYLPPLFETAPAFGYLGLSSTITDQGLVRDVMLTNIEREIEDGHLLLKGDVVNNGTNSLSTIKLLATLYDDTGALRWVEGAFVKEILRPGQISRFEIKLPLANEVKVISELNKNDIDINIGLTPRNPGPKSKDGTIPLNGLAGYSAVRLYIDPHIYQETF